MTSNTKNGNFLVILEDEPAHAEAIRRSLTGSDTGCRVIVADSLEEFNSLLRDLTPSLVLADINLPDGSAFSILHDDPEDQPWPVVVMTSYGDEETAVRAIKSGALDYIVKSTDAFRNIGHVIKRNLREWHIIQKSREHERNFRMLFERMSQGVIYLNADGKITEANPAAEQITGYALNQMKEGAFFSPEYWVTINDDGSFSESRIHPALDALQQGMPVAGEVMGMFNFKSGEFKWLLLSAVPEFRDNENKPYQVFATFTDITQLKITETELKTAKAKAEESDRLKSVFLANMSHEIRTPMNGILGFADLLREPGISDDEQKMYIEVINSSGKRMLEIINDLIDISRIEAGQIEIKKDRTDILRLMHELLLFFNPEAEEKGIELKSSIKLPGDEFYILTDRTKLAQVITNLLKNALKFTGQNGSIELGCMFRDDSNMFFYVKDTGAGIRKEIQNKIFERFRQGDKANEHDGVGLGLAISKAYVELLGGTIGIESEPGQGSKFYFTLPFSGTITAAMTLSGKAAG